MAINARFMQHAQSELENFTSTCISNTELTQLETANAIAINPLSLYKEILHFSS